MLDSLAIQNFRLFKELNIPVLKRVNLFTGRNNTGKSSILEAVSVYASKGDLSWIMELLERRGEVPFRRYNRNADIPLLEIEKIFASLFYNRTTGSVSIMIGPDEPAPLEEMVSRNSRTLSLRILYYIEERIKQQDLFKEEVVVSRKRTIIDRENLVDNYSSTNQPNLGIEITFGSSSNIISMNRIPRTIEYKEGDFQFITPRNVEKGTNASLWDNIALTDKEQYVIDALRIIEPGIERIAFISEDEFPRVRNAVVKISNNTSIVPLKSMGDGINRILTIVLALVNADNSYLLIDEFENGLHYSVQEKIWEMIFLLSDKLKIQVFATTHSNDCIQAFAKVVQEKYSGVGIVYRLDNIEEEIVPVELTAENIKAASQFDIEMR